MPYLKKSFLTTLKWFWVTVLPFGPKPQEGRISLEIGWGERKTGICGLLTVNGSTSFKIAMISPKMFKVRVYICSIYSVHTGVNIFLFL